MDIIIQLTKLELHMDMLLSAMSSLTYMSTPLKTLDKSSPCMTLMIMRVNTMKDMLKDT